MVELSVCVAVTMTLYSCPAPRLEIVLFQDDDNSLAPDIIILLTDVALVSI